MKVKEGFVLKPVEDVTIVVPTGKVALDFNGMITLNDTCAFLWHILEKGATEDELISKILSKYDVDEMTARTCVSRFIEKLSSEGLIE